MIERALSSTRYCTLMSTWISSHYLIFKPPHHYLCAAYSLYCQFHCSHHCSIRLCAWMCISNHWMPYFPMGCIKYLPTNISTNVCVHLEFVSGVSVFVQLFPVILLYQITSSSRFQYCDSICWWDTDIACEARSQVLLAAKEPLHVN